jgi:hypothetical protein
VRGSQRSFRKLEGGALSWIALLFLGAAIGGIAGCIPAADLPTRRAPPDPCGTPIAGESLLGPPVPIVVMGETHGTREIPAAFAQIVCRAAARRPNGMTLVALEIPSSAQASIDAFLESDGDAAARQALIHEEFWQREYQDGRSSISRVDLLDALRRYRAAGRKLAVLAVDPGSEDPARRDSRMASAIAEAIVSMHPEETLALVGDVHSRVLPGYPWDPAADYRSLAAELRTKYPDLIGLHVTAASGSAWICTSDIAAECGIHPFRAREVEGRTPRIVLDPKERETGWSGTLFLTELTPSEPAKEAPLSRGPR